VFKYSFNPGYNDTREIVSELYAFRITLLQRGFTMPRPDEDTIEWLRKVETVFTAVVPYIRDGHIARAKEASAQYSLD